MRNSTSRFTTRREFIPSVVGTLGTCLIPSQYGRAIDDQLTEAKKKLQEAIDKGLEYLKKSQGVDGKWSGTGGAYPVALTALAGMALLMEGSNLKEGKYSEQIAKAVDFLTKCQQTNGLFALAQGADFGNYIHGHGFATMFLACVYGEAGDKDEQLKIEKAIKKAVEFTAKAQFTRKHMVGEGKTVTIGGWGYTSDAEARSDEGSTTVTQIQALRAARNAGIAVPKEAIDKGVAYLEACTTPAGGLIYSYSAASGRATTGQERPPITAAAVACSFSAGQYKGDLCKKWVKFCKEKISYAKSRDSHDEYQSYYFAQFVYILGDDHYGGLFPNEDKATWLT